MGTVKDVWEIITARAEWKEVREQAMKVPILEKRIADLEAKLTGGSGTVCDHCGSSAVTRIGSRPSATPFGSLGAKDALFRCNICGKETAVLIDP